MLLLQIAKEAKLRLIKLYVRSNLGGNRLPTLFIPSIKNNCMHRLDFNYIGSSFASAESQRLELKMVFDCICAFSFLFVYSRNQKLYPLPTYYVLGYIVLHNKNALGGSRHRNSKAAGHTLTPQPIPKA